MPTGARLCLGLLVLPLPEVPGEGPAANPTHPQGSHGHTHLLRPLPVLESMLRALWPPAGHSALDSAFPFADGERRLKNHVLEKVYFLSNGLRVDFLFPILSCGEISVVYKSEAAV